MSTTALTPELSELASTAGTVVDPTDLQGLTALRDKFEAVGVAMSSTNPAAGSSANDAVKFIEKMIFNEFPDLDAALALVKQTADELCGIVSSGAPPAAARPAVEKATEDHGAASDLPDLTEQLIKEDDRSLIIEFITEATGHIEAAEVEILKLEDNPDDAEAIKGIFRAFHTVKGVAGFVNLKQVGALAHAAENLLDLARSGKMPMGPAQVNVVLESIDALKILVADIQRAEHTNTVAPQLPILPALLGKLHDIASGKISSGAAPVAKTDAAPKAEADHGPAAPAGGGGDSSVKISTDRLDQLINTVGELVISQAMVSQDISLMRGVSSRASRNMSQLEKITRELQDISMSMRMVPINGIFRKMTRLVRDLASRLSKDVEFVTSGSETELDRTLVESIGDPLVHMVRNAVDHGLEIPADRIKAGKSPTGRVELKAFHQGGSIVIQIIDDGKGLNKKRIVQKATDAGIIQPGADLTDEQIFQLIFHAGLSTAEKVTEVSGRGVGMDVVRKNIEALRGRVEITSVEGKGSTFTIRLPLTLAIIEGLVIRVGDEKFIVPLGNIDQSLRPTPDQLTHVIDRGETLRVRDELIPVFRLHKLFKIENAKNDATDALLVIVRDNRASCALLVDELLGHKQVVIKSLGPTVGSVRGVSGGAILGDGNISLILDVPGLLDLAMGR